MRNIIMIYVIDATPGKLKIALQKNTLKTKKVVGDEHQIA